MQIQIKHSPSFASATITLAPNEAMKAEASAMISKTPALTFRPAPRGVFAKGLNDPSVVSRSSRTRSPRVPKEARVSGGPGTGRRHRDLDAVSQTVFLQSGAYLASAMGVEVDSAGAGPRRSSAAKV